MNLVVHGEGKVAPTAVEELGRRMVHPLCGLSSRVGFLLRGRPEPRFAVAGGQLSGVHRLLGQVEAGSYHIGGVGLTRHEALVRTLGESAERYCQLVSVASGLVPVHTATVGELFRDDVEVVDPSALAFYSEDQYADPDFLFRVSDAAAPYGWVEMRRVPDGRPVQVPAQLALVGYLPHRHPDEPWLAPAMTTGTATQTTATAARRGALLELIQVDTAMGHWFGPAAAPRITVGSRLAPLRRLTETWMGRSATPAFHYLPSPDLPAHSVACVLRQGGGRRPVVAVGLGGETRLVEACYKALLEAVGVLQLAKTGMANAARDGEWSGARSDETRFFDLDANVVHYGDGGGAEVLAEKFPADLTVPDGELPADFAGDASTVVDWLQEVIVRQGLGLFELDLTLPDIADLGLVTMRVWSPDLLALALPSAPPRRHPRFTAHGGPTNERPHPYP
ncbi:MAG: YcaO-like family protein [Actinomycetota bacterium]|nr:YcaO-like family protein [Actinomycetota bacterium]